MSVMMVEVLLDVMRDQLIDFVGGYKECGCLLKERDARERFASMSSDDRKKQELTAHEGLPHDILMPSKHPAHFETSRDNPRQTRAGTQYSIRQGAPRL
jgi:hypothetical protein